MTHTEREDWIASSPAEEFLSGYGDLSEADRQAVRDRLGPQRVCEPGQSPLSGPAAQTILVVSGWAGAVCDFPDGRRNVAALYLPGDLVRGPMHRGGGLDIIAFTGLKTLEAEGLARFLDGDEAQPSSRLIKAWAAMRLAVEQRSLRHAIRLGRMTAYERTADLFLELMERQQAVGGAGDGRMSMPLTQDVLADHLGVSVVHMNRTIQQLRRDQLIIDGAGRLSVPNLDRLREARPQPCGV